MKLASYRRPELWLVSTRSRQCTCVHVGPRIAAVSHLPHAPVLPKKKLEVAVIKASAFCLHGRGESFLGHRGQGLDHMSPTISLPRTVTAHSTVGSAQKTCRKLRRSHKLRPPGNLPPKAEDRNRGLNFGHFFCALLVEGFGLVPSRLSGFYDGRGAPYPRFECGPYHGLSAVACVRWWRTDRPDAVFLVGFRSHPSLTGGIGRRKSSRSVSRSNQPASGKNTYEQSPKTASGGIRGQHCP